MLHTVPVLRAVGYLVAVHFTGERSIQLPQVGIGGAGFPLLLQCAFVEPLGKAAPVLCPVSALDATEPIPEDLVALFCLSFIHNLHPGA